MICNVTTGSSQQAHHNRLITTTGAQKPDRVPRTLLAATASELCKLRHGLFHRSLISVKDFFEKCPKAEKDRQQWKKIFDRGITTETRKRTKTKIFGSKTKSEKRKKTKERFILVGMSDSRLSC